MRIRQIELNGFKSFAERTVLSLHSGITCIVGPNGCGKSNVVDAFKWVLGEQSVKSLRGERMEEVIFQGSSTVKQKGMAEVVLLVSQLEGGAPPEGNGNGNGNTNATANATGSNGLDDKITVSRRLYRSGESEYYLNKKQCRLKDIKDIFLDTGLDVKSYSILDQGKVSEIINTKPQDRRFLIEEVAGVMKYKVRKNEALSKLESSKQNLQRVNDIVHEVRRQINSLDRQVKKAERYKRLIEELKGIELRIAKREFLRLSETLRSLEEALERLKEADSSRRGELSTLENQIEVRRIELVGKEKALTELENRLYAKEKGIAESEKQIAVLKAGIENREADILRLANQQNFFDIKKEELSGKSEELKATIASFSTDIAGLQDQLTDRKSALAEIELAIAEKEGEIEDKRRELFSISEQISQRRNELHKFQSSNETLTYRESASLKDMETIRAGITTQEQTLRESEETLRTITARHMDLQAERDRLAEATERLGSEIESARISLAREREALASTTSRLSSLRELTIDKSLQDFLTDSRESIHFSGSVLSDIINAGSAYEQALEAALAEKVNAVILTTIDDIVAAVALIKEKQLGRTPLLYTGFGAEGDAGKAATPGAVTHDALIGRASDFITIENTGLRSTVLEILENIYIVRDLAGALELRKERTLEAAALVTLDGEFIDRDGVIFAGHGKDILKRKREIKELQKTIQEQQETVARIEAGITAATASLAEHRESLRTIESAIIDIEKEISLIGHSLKSHQDDLERKRRKLSFLEGEVASLAAEKESLDRHITAKAEEIGQLERENTALHEGIAVIQNSLSAVKMEYEHARTRLTDLKLSIASYREKMEAFQREEASLARTVEELDQDKENAAKEIIEAEQKLKDSGVELERHEEAIKTLVVEVDGMRQERASRKEIIDAEQQALVEQNAVLREIRSALDAVSQELADAASKAVEHRLRLENIESGISQKYGLDIRQEMVEIEGFDPAEDDERVEQLNDKVRDLGPVNLGTIEEYEELKGRYDFLTRQQEDLTLSIAELEEAISRINASTRRKLREAYDALRTHFVEVFTTIFGGGRADLILTDEENILESGLDIIAQPPGKKLQNLNLLSGGEKALTSLALLFAGFLIKPSPLCILDEVDAPLDESNTVRFAGMIRDLAKGTQFIVITHNKTTMESADYLYGITMPEPGVSRAMSLQFAEIEQAG